MSSHTRLNTIVLCLAGMIAASLAQTHPGFYVNGRFLYDKCGNKVILRGVDEMIIYSGLRTSPVPYQQIAKSGANAVRIMWTIDASVPVADLGTTLTNCEAQGMIPMPELHNWGGTWNPSAAADWWTKSEVVAVIKSHETKMLLNLANEMSAPDDASYKSGYSAAVSRLRAAGIHVPIVLDGSQWGRDETALLDNGQYLLDQDPDHNLIFSWHPWDPGNQTARIHTAIDQSVSKNLPFIIGEFAEKSVGCVCCIPYVDMIAYCQQNQIGWLAWSWGYVQNGDCAEMDMTHGGDFTTLYGWGLVAATTDPNSIKNTAVRSPFMVSGACNGVGARIEADKTSGPMPLIVTFDGSGSTGAGLTYAWTFGDGGTSTAQKPQHTFAAAGSYKVKLTVSSGGNQGVDSTVITVVDPSKEPVKISCGKTAVASSQESGGAGSFPAANAVDCDLTTRWASNTTNDEWIYVDLGSVQSFGRVILRWETAYASSYKLQTSNDAQTWTDLKSVTNGNGGNDTLDVTASARYVRMLGITRGTQYGYSLYEFEVYQMPTATALRSLALMTNSTSTVRLDRSSMILTDIRGRTVAVGRLGWAESMRGPCIYIVLSVSPSSVRRVIVEGN